MRSFVASLGFWWGGQGVGGWGRPAEPNWHSNSQRANRVYASSARVVPRRSRLLLEQLRQLGDVDRDAPRLVAGEKGGRGRKRAEPASENGDSPRTGSCEGEGQEGAARPREITPKMRRSSSSPVAWFDRPSHTTHGRYVGRSHLAVEPLPRSRPELRPRARERRSGRIRCAGPLTAASL